MITTASDIYDFEGVLEAAVKVVLDSVEVKNYTPADAPEFQKERPRFELYAEIDNSGDRLFPEVGKESTPGSMREMDFFGKLHSQLITTSQGKVHYAYRSQCRDVFATMKERVNGVYLLNHKLQWFKTESASGGFTQEKDLYVTTFSHSFKLTINMGAMRDYLNPPSALTCDTAPTLSVNNDGDFVVSWNDGTTRSVVVYNFNDGEQSWDGIAGPQSGTSPQVLGLSGDTTSSRTLATILATGDCPSASSAEIVYP